ncbi:MAG: hypothetical protein G01um101470_69 [Parcubacteria group bacterium Gr01-1014_70]|nr:MAG: hypothetical protein G01um101470_69 [Parcubacteria group bacterium Gr01-1014_70]
MNFFENKRTRIILISTGIVGILVAVGLYLFFRGDADGDGSNSDSFFGTLVNIIEEQPMGGDPLSGGVIVGEAEGGEETQLVLYRVSDEPVVGATISPDDKRLRYFKHATGLFEADFTGTNETRISHVTIPAILDVQWTPSKSYAIISAYTDGGIRRSYTHFSGTSTASSAFLPNDIEEITTSLTDEMIAYTVSKEGKTILFTARPNNTNIKNIYTLPVPDFELSWPAANSIALKQKSSAYAPSVLYTLNPTSKSLTRLLAEKEGLDVLWPTGGKQMLTMETSREGTVLTLNITSLEKNTVTPLPFATLPEKCAWVPKNTTVLYCAVPEAIPRGANLPDEWWQGVVSFNDVLWRIDVETGEQKQILPVHQLDAMDLFLSDDESFLFFTNKKDGLLWSLKLN